MDVLLGFVRVVALGTRVQLRAGCPPLDTRCVVVPMSGDALVGCEGSTMGIVAVGDVPVLPFLGLSIWEDGPLQRPKDERPFLRGLRWSIRDSVHLSHQVFRGDRFILVSEEVPWSSASLRCPVSQSDSSAAPFQKAQQGIIHNEPQGGSVDFPP